MGEETIRTEAEGPSGEGPPSLEEARDAAGGGGFLRRWGRTIQSGLVVVTYLQMVVTMGLALVPGVWGLLWWWEASASLARPVRALGLAVGIAAAYVAYGVVCVFLIPLLATVTGSRTIPEGRYPLHSLQALRWATHNAWILILRYTFMDFLRCTFLHNLFYRLMGARIGRGVQINTTIVGDVCLLEVGDGTVLGGDSTIIGHSVERGELVVRPTRIGRDVTIGLMSVVMAGCTIGDGCVVAANSVVPKDRTLPPGSVWAGVPARRIDGDRAEEEEEEEG